MPFINYAVQGLRDELAEQIEWITERQIKTTWMQHIGESFSSLPQPKHRSQLGLMEALGTAPVAMKNLTTLSATVARDCAKVSPSSLSRDLAKLKKLGLLVIDSDYLVRANRDQTITMRTAHKPSLKLPMWLQSNRQKILPVLSISPAFPLPEKASTGKRAKSLFC